MLFAGNQIILGSYNLNGISVGMTELRVFLGVEYQTEGIEWIKGFTKYLGESIPENTTMKF